MTTSITVKEKNVYGKVLVYPACQQSEKIASLLKTKTFSYYVGGDLDKIRDLGFEVIIIKLP